MVVLAGLEERPPEEIVDGGSGRESSGHAVLENLGAATGQDISLVGYPQQMLDVR